MYFFFSLKKNNKKTIFIRYYYRRDILYTYVLEAFFFLLRETRKEEEEKTWTPQAHSHDNRRKKNRRKKRGWNHPRLQVKHSRHKQHRYTFGFGFECNTDSKRYRKKRHAIFSSYSCVLSHPTLRRNNNKKKIKKNLIEFSSDFRKLISKWIKRMMT